MKLPIKLSACAILAFFALSGCDFGSNTDDESLRAKDELSSEQGKDNGGDPGLVDPKPLEPTPQQPITEMAKPSPEVYKWIIEHYGHISRGIC